MFNWLKCLLFGGLFAGLTQGVISNVVEYVRENPKLVVGGAILAYTLTTATGIIISVYVSKKKFVNYDNLKRHMDQIDEKLKKVLSTGEDGIKNFETVTEETFQKALAEANAQ